MKRFLSLYILCVYASCGIFGQMAKDSINPFNGKTVIGGNAELIFQYAPKSGNQIRKIYDYNLNGTFDLKSTESLNQQDTNATGNRDMDVVTGDFDGDYYDEIISAWECNNHSIYLSISSVKANFGLDVKKDAILHDIVQTDTSYNYYIKTFYPVPSIKLTAGDFDYDYQKEFLLSYYGLDNFLHILLMEVDENLNFVKLAEIGNLELLSSENIDIHLYDLTVGDLDSDGLDEIFVINPYDHTLIPNQTAYLLHSKIALYDYSCVDQHFIQTSSLIDITDKHTPTLGIQTTELWYYNVAACSGDINGDGIDEIVYGYVTTLNFNLSFPVPFNTYLFTRFNALTIKNDLSGIESKYSKDETLVISDAITPDTQDQNSLSFSIDLKAADISGNGKAEIIAYARNRLSVFEMNDNNVIEFRTCIEKFLHRAINARNVLQIGDLDADTLATEWQNEIVVFDYDQSSINVYKPVIDTSKLIVTSLSTIKTVLPMSSSGYDSYVLSLGDFDGDGIKLGKPVHTTLRSFFMPAVIINAPPNHFDVLYNSVYDINQRYPFDENEYLFYTQYQKSESSTNYTRTESKHSWALSGEYSYGFGKKFRASIKANIGMDFESKSEDSHTLAITENNTVYEDEVFGKTITYHLFEYPVFYRGKFLKNFIALVPVNEKDNYWGRSRLNFSNQFALNHEFGNILSYPSYTALSDIPDLMPDENNEKRSYLFSEREIYDASSDFWLLENTDFTANSLSRTFNVGVSAQASYKSLVYSVKLQADYKYSRISYSSTTLSDDIKIKGNFGHIDSPYAEARYNVKPFVYWSTNGALVVDYSVDLIGDWWILHYGTKSDPAFIMPFRYEDEKGSSLITKSKKLLTSDIRYYPYDAMPGDTIEIETTARNFSLKDAEKNILVSLYLGDPDCGGMPLDLIDSENNTLDFGKIKARSFKTQSVRYKTPNSIPAKPWIFAIIDTTASNEIHINNNKAFTHLFSSRFPEDGEWKDLKDNVTVGIHDYESFDPFHALNFPNPCKESTIIRFSVKDNKSVALIIYNSMGQKIEQRMIYPEFVGWHSEPVDLSTYAPGIYFYHLSSEGNYVIKKMVVE